jgi:O-antigen/teichoic acid export membrane protein
MATASALAARAWKQVRDPSMAILISQAIAVALRLGSNLVLAHLLMPRAFGLLAITTLVATAIGMLTETGLWLSVMRKGDKVDRDWLDQLWTLHAIRGVGLSVIAAILGPIMAKAYGEPQLIWLLPVSNIWLTIIGFESLQPIVRVKELKPWLGLKLQLVNQGVASLVSIAVALVYPSAWALVGGLLAGAAVMMVMSHIWAREPLPRPHITREFVREQWKLASWLAVSTALGFFGGQIDRLLFPVWFGAAAFGVYSIALTLALFPLQLGQRWADTVYLPAIAKLSKRPSDAAQGEMRTLSRTVAIYAAVGSGALAGVGQPFFTALYPKQFALAATFVQILAVTTYATFLTYLHRRTFLYQGMTRLEASIEASRLILFLGALAAATFAVGRPAAAEYIALYAIVQVVVYAGLMVVGRIRRLVHFRDDLPAHLIFLAVAAGLTLLNGVVGVRFGTFAALVVSGLIGGAICLVAAARLGLPKLPTEPAQPVDPDFVDPLEPASEL